MNNNEVLCQIRDIFDLNNSKLIEIFGLADCEVTEGQIGGWLQTTDDSKMVRCRDVELATFLNGFINARRGKKEGEQPEPQTRLGNNAIFNKLKIALNLKAEDILDIFSLVDYTISKHELAAFFRKTSNKHFRKCSDEVLEHFLSGLKLWNGE
jgi:uncharacterized protein YehS (DUF1456 family)